MELTVHRVLLRGGRNLAAGGAGLVFRVGPAEWQCQRRGGRRRGGDEVRLTWLLEGSEAAFQGF